MRAGNANLTCSICKGKFLREYIKKENNKNYCPSCLQKKEEAKKEKIKAKEELKREEEAFRKAEKEEFKKHNYICSDCRQSFSLDGTENKWGRGTYCLKCWKKEKHVRDRKLKRIVDYIQSKMEENGYEEEAFSDNIEWILAQILKKEKETDWSLDDIRYALHYTYDRENWDFNINGIGTAIVFGYGNVKGILRNKSVLEGNIEKIRKEKGIFSLEEEDVIINYDDLKAQVILDEYREFKKRKQCCDLNSIDPKDYSYSNDYDEELWE